MSKKKPEGLIGLDGKPLKYVPPPKPAEFVTVTNAHTEKPEGGSFIGESWLSAMFRASSSLTFTVGTTAPKRDLKTAVDAQLAEVHAAAPEGWKGHAELPAPSATEMERYDVAQEWALRHCPHKNVASTIYAKGEFQCQDCGRYLDKNPNTPRWFTF